MKRQKNNQEKNFIPYHTAIEQLDQLEVKYNLFDYQIDGWSVWIILRSLIGYRLSGQPITPSKEKVTRLNHALFAMQDVISLLCSQSPVQYVIQSPSSYLVEKYGAFYKDVKFDDFLSDIESYFKIEEINNKAFLKRSHQAFIRSNIRTSIIISLANVVRKFYKNNTIDNVAEEILFHLQQEPNLQTPSFDEIRYFIADFFYRKLVYTWLLRYLRPKYVLVVNMLQYALVAAAKELGITTIEFQHGFISNKSHFLYSLGSHVVEHKPHLPIADYFFVYGNYWKESLMEKGFWQDELRVVGNTRLDKFRTMIRKQKNGTFCTLLWTSQDISKNDTIKFIADFVKLSRGFINIRLIIKLHPARESNKEPYKIAFGLDENTQIYLGSEEPSTFELMAQSDMHISISSTCHYEALGLGLPTVILAFPTYEKVLHLYEQGYALLAHTPEELVDIVQRWQTYKVTPEVSTYYFKPNALANIKQEFGMLSKKNKKRP